MPQQTSRWRRTQLANPDAPRIPEEDWMLVDAETGEPLARIFDTGEADMLGSWRWEVAPFFVTANQGCALSGTDAWIKCDEVARLLPPQCSTI